MEPEEIVRKLRRTIYKFTYAHKVKSDLKSLDEEIRDDVRRKLRSAMLQPENKDISDVLRQIIT